ncbi:hypothetical protein KRP22_008258 [Phytophthora ramorum]|nr:hypothetical protein KRP22_3731 [Phytophthora ramorum]
MKTQVLTLENGGNFFAPETLKVSLARRAYFTELKEVLAEKDSLEQRLSRLDALHQFMLKRLRNNEFMVDRLANRWGRLVMRQTLADWKKIIIRKKYTRVLLEKTRWRWAKQKLMRLFRRWNDYAVAEKVRKLHEQIQLFRDNKHDFQELIGRLQVQIESAKVEMKAHREHLDLAKRHTLSLEELLTQLELRVRQSQERKLQTISNQWGKLCFAKMLSDYSFAEVVSKPHSSWLIDDESKQTSEELSEELQRVEEVLEEHYEHFRRIYRFYANIDSSRLCLGASGGDSVVDEARFFHKISVTMSLAEFYVFLKECQVFGKARPFPYDLVQSVFEKICPDVAASVETATSMLPLTHTLSAPTKQSGSGNAREMSQAEFVEALVHIIRSGRVQWRGDNGMIATLDQRFRKFLEEIIFPNAMHADEEKSNVFPPQLLTFECREVFTTHHKKLRSMYVHFVASEVKPESRFANQDSVGLRGSSKMLSANGFVNCCQHFDLFRDNLLHFDDVQHILAETLQLERESIHFDLAPEVVPTSADDIPQARTVEPKIKSKIRQHEESVLMTLAEFLEALAAVACYLNPDVFVPLAAKLDAFFSERLDSSAIA